MAGPSLNSTVIARLAQALYGYKLGAATLSEATTASNALGGIDALVNALYARDFAGLTTAAVAAQVVANVGVTGTAQIAEASAYVKAQLDAAPAASRGAVLANVVNSFSTLTLPAYANAVSVFNKDIAAAVAYGQTVGTLDVDLKGGLFSLVSPAAGIADISGNLNVRIEITRTTDQVTGLDLNRNGSIETNGKENVNPTALDDGKNFKIWDAYARNPLNTTDAVNNYLGNIYFDGTGFSGDGKSTNGNIFLGGLGRDIALGGTGNDFLAGGGIASPTGAVVQAGDQLSGGRNADFFFAELSLLSPTDGNNSIFNGGTTADDIIAGTTGPRGLGTQENDWILLEVSDDDEPITVQLGDGNISSSTTTRSATLVSVESINASGNLYGFLNAFDVAIGSRAYDGNADNSNKAGSENYGRGSTAQLVINGNEANNAVIAGYDNDFVFGGSGNDLLIGGDLRYLIVNKNNPNLLDSKGGLNLNVGPTQVVTDGIDDLQGGIDNDSIVFEAASGKIDGGAHFDTLFVTEYSYGRIAGTTSATDSAAAQAAALAALSGDQIVRLDLGNGSGGTFRDYGGANRGLGAGQPELPTADQTNYKSELGTKPATTVANVEAVITTGLGTVDYNAAGTNNPELAFANLQNTLGTAGRFDVRGIDGDNASTTKFGSYFTDANFGLAADGTALTNQFGGGSGSANTGTGVAFRDGSDNIIYLSSGADTLEGRGGDDELGGGRGDDNFIFDFGDGTDIIRRQKDADGNNVWDTDASGNLQYVQDFRADPSGVAATRLLIDFGTTDLTSSNTVVGSVQLVINPAVTGGSIKLDSGNLSAAKSIGALATAVNAAFAAIDSSITVTAVGNALLVQDAKGRDISDTASEGYAVFVSISNSNASTVATLNPGGQTLQENDRILFVDYQARANNTLFDDTKVELGNQAQDLLVGFGGSTTLANDQAWRVQFQNLQPGDKVTVSLNGTPFTRTVATGEDTDSFILALTNQINNETLDINTASGRVAAAQANVITGSTNESVLVLTQLDVGAGANKTYVNAPVVTIVAANGATSSAFSQIANTSSTSIELLGYAGRDGNLNADNVLFLGRTGQATLATDKSTAILQTAKDAGQTLTGKDVSATVSGVGINGDDQLIGGLGNDTLNGGTGDDRFVGSWGTDTINGGTGDYIDSVVFEEATFGTGTKFTIVPSAGLDDVGGATVTAVLDTKTGVTTLTQIEEVRTLSNSKADTIDFSGLSNSVAAATGTSANLDKAALVVPTVASTNYNEGVRLNLTETNAGLVWAADRNADDDTADSGEIGTGSLGIFGVENVIGGAANDIVALDKTQAASSNVINLAGELPDLTLAGNFTEGRDLVIYDHTSVTGPTATNTNRPVLTVKVESGANTDTVSATGGVLLTSVVVDTLIGVEELDVANAATRTTDTLDLTATAGATVNFGAGGVGVGRSLGGQVSPATSVPAVEANTLENGGVSLTGGTLGNELLEITGITQLDVVAGSAGSDRVIVGTTLTNANTAAVAATTATTPFNFHTLYTLANKAYDVKVTVENNALYTFNLAAGDDTVDYRQSSSGVAVVLDFSADDKDRVVVDTNADGVYFDHTNQDRIDLAVGVERYYGSNSARDNIIDLSRADTAVTVTFGAEVSASKNEVKDPNGIDANAGATKTPDDQVTGINVSTATNPSVARFMEATDNPAVGTDATVLWERIEGSNQAETVLFSQYQDRLANEIVNLRGGANTVSYAAGVKLGQNDVYTFNVADTGVAFTTSGGFTWNVGNVAHTSIDGTGTDTLSFDRTLDANNAVVDGTLSVIGSTNTNDVVSIAGLAASSGLDLPASANDLTGATKAGVTRNETVFIRDVVGSASGYNLVDLGTGIGTTTGVVTQDVNLSFNGAKNIADNASVSVSAFENIVGSATNDRLFGNDNNNTITGNGGNDVYVGRGGGDTLNLGAGSDRVVYNGAGDTADALAGTNKAAAGEFDVINGFGTAGNDLIVINGSASFNLVNTLAQAQAAAANVNPANGAIVFFGVDDAVANAGALDMAAVVAGLGASATLTTGVAVGTQMLFAVDTTDNVGLYLWTASTAGDTTVGAAELQLLAQFGDDNDVAPTLATANAANLFTGADLAVRRTATVDNAAATVLFNDSVRDELAYTALAQSQYGQIDTIGKFVAGAPVNAFEGGVDKIDLSGLGLNALANGGLALNAIIVVNRTGAGSQITDANANNFFLDNTSVAGDFVRRAVVVEFDNDDIDGGTAGTQARARIFVDLDGDGNLDTTKDLFVDLATDGSTTNTTGVVTAGTGNGGVPTFGDFIFIGG